VARSECVEHVLELAAAKLLLDRARIDMHRMILCEQIGHALGIEWLAVDQGAVAVEDDGGNRVSVWRALG